MFGFRGVFTNVSFSQTVEAARQVLADQELALLMASTTDIRPLISGTVGYRLRHAALGASTPNSLPHWRSSQQGESRRGPWPRSGPESNEHGPGCDSWQSATPAVRRRTMATQYLTSRGVPLNCTRIGH